jgi:predicted ATPase
MAPLTLFFGANSSGKSSIGQLLMMLKQTVESQDRKAVFHPGGRNSAVQLGSYQDMVYQHDINRKIVFEYRWSLKNILEIKDFSTRKTNKINKIHFKSEVGLNNTEDKLIVVNNFNYKLFNNNRQVLSVGMSSENNNYSMASDEYALIRKKMRAWPLKDVVRFYGFPDEAVAYYQNADFVQELNLEHENLFHSVYYLGPLRTRAERFYTWGGIAPESVGFFGENTVAAILAAKTRRMNLGFRQPTKSFDEIIAYQLKALGLIEKFRVNRISEQRQEYEVKVRSKGARELVDLPDVGVGISQVLPVLAQCFYAPPGSVIIMEQPEIHLHPGAQSALADVMIDVIQSRENSADRKIQLIIETHSEHFLRRLQRRIAEEAIAQEKVAAYFADASRLPAALRALEIDPWGNIRNWPEHFFGDEMGDITGQAEAALKRRG